MYSTVVIGFGIPLFIAILSMGLSMIGLAFRNVHIQDIVMALGTWIGGDNPPHAPLVFVMTLVWFVVTFFLTVRFESRLLSKQWAKRDATSTLTPAALSWSANLWSYAGLLLLTLFFWAGGRF